MYVVQADPSILVITTTTQETTNNRVYLLKRTCDCGFQRSQWVKESWKMCRLLLWETVAKHWLHCKGSVLFYQLLKASYVHLLGHTRLYACEHLYTRRCSQHVNITHTHVYSVQCGTCLIMVLSRSLDHLKSWKLLVGEL